MELLLPYDPAVSYHVPRAQGSTHSTQLGALTETHEVQRLSTSSTYRFWVTASTRVGEGEPSRIATVKPSSKGDESSTLQTNNGSFS